MKKLFIYYSNSGNGDVVADYLKEKNIDIRKVVPTKPLPKSFILSILSGGFKATTNHKDKLDNFDPDIKKYDEIIIGSPIWNARFSSPINTVLSLLDLKDKKVSFILYSGSGESPKATNLIKEKYPKSTIYDLKSPKDNIKELDKLNLL